MTEQSRTTAGEKDIEKKTKRSVKSAVNVTSESANADDGCECRIFGIAFALIIAAIAVWAFIGIKIL